MDRTRLPTFIGILLAALALPSGCKPAPITKGGGRDPGGLPEPGSAQAEHGSRVALVIGNSRYKTLQRLDACTNDAENMVAAFKKIGVTVHGGKPLLDLNTDQMDSAIAAFARSLDRGSEAYLYYSGHGAQIGGTNYLLPVNYDAQYEVQARRQGISLDAILETLDKTDSRMRVVILDACRNPGDLLPGEPKTKDSTRAKGLNEQRVDAPETLVCFATKHGTASLADDRASFYSRVLAEEIVKPGRVDEILRVVGRRVFTETDKRQQPFTYGNLFQDHFFVRPVHVSTARPTIAEATPVPVSPAPHSTPPPTPVTVAKVTLSTPVPASLQKPPNLATSTSSPASPASTPTNGPTAMGWRTYGPGQAPKGRTVSLEEAVLITGEVGERLYLRGEFRVTASGSNRAVLRDATKPDDRSPRVIVEYPEGSTPPAERARVVRDNSRPYLINEIRRAADGVFSIYVKEIIAP